MTETRQETVGILGESIAELRKSLEQERAARAERIRLAFGYDLATMYKCI